MSSSLQPHWLQHARLLAISQSLLKLMSTEFVISANHLILCCLLLIQSSIFPSIKDFSSESAHCIRWPKYWSFIFSISPSNEYSGLVSCKIDWFDLLAVQGALKSLLQHHISKASVLQHSAFFMVLLSHPYMTIRKTIALIYRTLLAKWSWCILTHWLATTFLTVLFFIVFLLGFLLLGVSRLFFQRASVF